MAPEPGAAPASVIYGSLREVRIPVSSYIQGTDGAKTQPAVAWLSLEGGTQRISNKQQAEHGARAARLSG